MCHILQDKVAIVTGASRGIGRAISLALGGAGATVILTARNEAELQKTAAKVIAVGGRAHVMAADLTAEASIRTLVSQTAQQYRQLDILVNNAGIVYAGPLETTPTEQWDRCMAVNARGPFILCREAIPLLRKAPSACIVNVCSVVGVKSYPNQSAYSASKHALRGMSAALAQELHKDNIRVHVLCSGGVATEMVGRVRPDIKKDDLMQAEEIAELVLYLAAHKGNAVIDELHIRRAASQPWF